MYPWQTDQFVNGDKTAEYEYEMCQKTGGASGHFDKLKNFALKAKEQADAHDAIVASSETLLENARTAAQNAWSIATDVRARIIAANATPTPLPTRTPAPTATPRRNAPAAVIVPSPASTVGCSGTSSFTG